MSGKTKPKTFDCVQMMHRAALRIYQETKGMTLEEELAYWRRRHQEALEEDRQSPKARTRSRRNLGRF